MSSSSSARCRPNADATSAGHNSRQGSLQCPLESLPERPGAGIRQRITYSPIPRRTMCGTKVQTALQTAGGAISGTTRGGICPAVWQAKSSAACPAILPAIRQTPDRTAGQTAEMILCRIAAQTLRQIASKTALPALSLTAIHRMLYTVWGAVPQMGVSSASLKPNAPSLKQIRRRAVSGE